MPHRLKAEDLVAPSELAAALNWTEADTLGLCTGPFATDAEGRLPLRTALGLAIFARLGLAHLLEPRQAAVIAVDAANGAELRRDRSMVLAWKDGACRTAWFTNGVPHLPPVDEGEGLGSPLRSPMLVIPVSRMFDDLGRTVALLRERGPASASH